MIAAGSFSDPTVLVSLVTTVGALLAIVITGLVARRGAEHAKTERGEQSQKIAEIHVLVNSKMDEALQRVAALEQKLGLAAGEDIPAPEIVTTHTTEPPTNGDPP